MRTLPLLPAALVAVLALSATATACGDGGGAGGTPPDRTFSGSWSVVSLTVDGRKLTAPDAARLTLEPGQGGREAEATGNYGCNGFTAAVVFEAGSAITVRPGASTDMACADMRFETEFARLFQGRLTVREQPDTVTLKTAAGDEISLTTKPRTPKASLVDTVWTVDSLLGGGTASSLAAEAAGRARFTVAADGSASGNLGCNRFNAKATVEGNRLTFGTLTTTRMACEGGAGEVERALTGLFGSGPLDWRIQGDALTLTASGDGDGGAKGITAKAGSATG
ncbi:MULTISPECIES: META domain-containing protein [unclassified Streptomyces]|uniref:META domain-containing protein n=1 Tax=unclassified Streptomyces TaxID=2593676 RepID=UPI000DC7AE9A|nr:MULTISPECIES: META domain-containing protein [unclassified Streptomyces]AWZ06082.1 META domain-containing protein [Streptomyces sp. ICC4]AWZ13700.1 META domain-containing protein [Streptomyces sp. ICC1]